MGSDVESPSVEGLNDNTTETLVLMDRDGSDMPASAETHGDLEAALGGACFVGENPKWDEYLKYTSEERTRVDHDAELRNKEWIERVLGALKAAWIEVIDGRVVAASQHIWTRPDDFAIEAIAKKSGKAPFIFTSVPMDWDEETEAQGPSVETKRSIARLVLAGLVKVMPDRKKK